MFGNNKKRALHWIRTKRFRCRAKMLGRVPSIIYDLDEGADAFFGCLTERVDELPGVADDISHRVPEFLPLCVPFIHGSLEPVEESFPAFCLSNLNEDEIGEDRENEIHQPPEVHEEKDECGDPCQADR